MAHEEAVTQLSHGDNFLAAELRIGVRALGDALEIISGDIIHEELEHLRSQGRIPLFGKQLAPLVKHGTGKLRIGFRQVKTPIRGKASEEDIRKEAGWRAASRVEMNFTPAS